jgi:hypothetical protein
MVIAQYIRRMGILTNRCERVRCARRRFGRSDVIDVLAVLVGSAVRGERTLEAFDERLHPCAPAFMALVGRDRVPARSTLSRFLAQRSAEPVEARRALFLEDLRERHSDVEQHPCGLTDRARTRWKECDSDGTREAARHRAFSQTSERLAPPSMG